MNNRDPGLVLNDVDIKLHQRQLIAISHHVAPGTVLTIMGPSGSGKSSLLAYLSGFLDPVFVAHGEIILNGVSILDLPAHHRRLGILFQDPLLFPHMSVGENLLFGIPASIKANRRKDLAEQALLEAGLEGFFDRDPATLSGGQKSRVALMRVLLSEPQALLLDEPFSKLDTDRRSRMRELVFSKAKENNLPTILVTHDHADADAADGPVIEIEG